MVLYSGYWSDWSKSIHIFQWMQFMQLRKEAWKKIPDFNGVWTRDLAIPVQCSTNWAMKPPLKSWIFFQGSFIRNSINCVRCDDHFFIFISFSAVHIWFISYIINTHLFHGNIWTHNWPAPNVSGFIAQLVEHHTGIARSWVQFKPRWSPEFFFRLLYAIA